MKATGHSRSLSIDWTLVRKALRSAMQSEGRFPGRADRSPESRDIEISVLINDVFGGTIVKTHTREGWHFYNRINGERIDLTAQEKISTSVDSDSGSCPAVRAQTSGSFEQNDYATLFQRFVTALEESFGLGNYLPA